MLRCQVGPSGVTAEQFARLTELTELPNISLRIVPFSAGLHAGVLYGSFEVLKFAQDAGGVAGEPPTVYADRFPGPLYLDKPHEVERYDRAFRRVWNASLSEGASRDLLRATAADYE